MVDGGDPANSAPRTGGRVRSSAARDEVLNATMALLEEQGYGKITMEGVAARSGVAKSTIYRWWKSKALLVMEAQSEAVARRMPEPDTGSVAEDLTIFASELNRVVEFPQRMEALRGMMADAQLYPDFAGALRDWVQTRRAVVSAILSRGVERGELDADLDVEYATDLIFGPFWYRLLVGHAPLRPDLAGAEIARLLAGFRHPAAD
ncbi:TetR/AcrR family transcriptional regulator [Nocardia sp. NPDC052566]|uniref:TetR/AcrR family transcriptional regulator n=1 Tax=Nocardia sp. NPDC052566 TaxID=3364330 RepID=UPI0037CB735D